MNHSVIVMGVCACGKTTFGRRLAKRVGVEYIDGDDLHPESNVKKMASGEALDDSDREPWLASIRHELRTAAAAKKPVVISCSALKKSYRDLIRQGDPDLRFVFLNADRALILERIRRRRDHFMKDTLVDSQFSILEPPDGEPATIVLDASRPADTLVDDFLASPLMR